MTEHLTQHSPEQQHQTAAKPERHKSAAEHAAEKHTQRKHEKDHLQAIREARSNVHETVAADKRPNALKQLETAEKAGAPVHHTRINRELKQITLRRELQDIRRKLPAPQRALSRIIHQPTIRAVSEVAGKTISRPSGFLGGGLVALIGTSSYLYLARHIGFTYNYGVFLVLFLGGFVVGIVLELLVNMMMTPRRHSD